MAYYIYYLDYYALVTLGANKYDVYLYIDTETAEPLLMRYLPKQVNGLCSATPKNLGKFAHHWLSAHVSMASNWPLQISSSNSLETLDNVCGEGELILTCAVLGQIVIAVSRVFESQL